MPFRKISTILSLNHHVQFYLAIFIVNLGRIVCVRYYCCCFQNELLDLPDILAWIQNKTLESLSVIFFEYASSLSYFLRITIKVLTLKKRLFSSSKSLTTRKNIQLLRVIHLDKATKISI